MQTLIDHNTVYSVLCHNMIMLMTIVCLECMLAHVPHVYVYKEFETGAFLHCTKTYYNLNNRGASEKQWCYLKAYSVSCISGVKIR